jgi:hypothetical protein
MRPSLRWLSMTGLASGLLISTAVVGFSQGQPTPNRDPERHPHIRAAMRDLRQAANQLAQGDHDFGGHRAKALELVKQAEGELREAVEWAKAHPDADKGTASATQGAKRQ